MSSSSDSFFLFVCLFSETGFLWVALAVLELTSWVRWPTTPRDQPTLPSWCWVWRCAPPLPSEPCFFLKNIFIFHILSKWFPLSQILFFKYCPRISPLTMGRALPYQSWFWNDHRLATSQSDGGKSPIAFPFPRRLQLTSSWHKQNRKANRSNFKACPARPANEPKIESKTWVSLYKAGSDPVQAAYSSLRLRGKGKTQPNLFISQTFPRGLSPEDNRNN